MGSAWRGVAFVRRMVLVAAVVSFTTAASAQSTPDAGAIQGQNDLQREDLEDNAPRPGDDDSVTAPAREAPPEIPSGGPTFTLTRVDFDKSEFLSDAELAAIAAPFVGRAIDFSGIQALINAVNARYSELGIVTASASLPEQELTGGVLRIELIEGRVGTVRLEGATRSSDYVSRRIRLEPGTVVDVPKLGRRVATFNRTSEARVQTVLQPGTEFGMTDLTLSVTEPQRNSLEIFTDNFGTPNVGRYQLGGLFQHYGLLGLDDRLKLYGVYSEGNLAGNASYTFGFAPTGGRIGLSYSRSAIRIVDGPFEPLDVKGGSQGGGINFVQPLYGDATWLLLANAGGTVTNSVTTQSGLELTNNLTWKGTAGVTLGYYGSRVAFSVSPYYAYAHTDMRVVGDSEQVHFFAGSASLTAILPGELVLKGNGSWQVASQLLVTGDQLFQIGGPTTIRGYDSGAVSGGTGYYGSLELHRDLSPVMEGLDVFGFVDHGAVFSTAPRQVSLTALGAGLTYTYRNRVTFELTAGIPVGDKLPGQPELAVFGRIIVKAF